MFPGSRTRSRGRRSCGFLHEMLYGLARDGDVAAPRRSRLLVISHARPDQMNKQR